MSRLKFAFTPYAPSYTRYDDNCTCKRSQMETSLNPCATFVTATQLPRTTPSK
jgi:hypothetical protein